MKMTSMCVARTSGGNSVISGQYLGCGITRATATDG